MPRISVIIPNYNGREHVRECLTTLAQQDITEPYDTVLVDNASNDDSLTIVQHEFPHVKTIQTGANLGFAAACNKGIQETSGDYIVLLNNDTRLPKDWLRELVHAADQAPPDVFAISSLLLLYHHPDRINSAGGLFSPMGGGFDLHLGEPLANVPLPDTPYETAIAPAAAVLYRRQLYQQLGGLDDRYFLYFEDVELSYRAWKQGYRCLIAPRSRLHHKHGGTTGPRDSPIKVYWGQRNRLRMIARNFSPAFTVRSLAWLGVYTWYKTLALLLGGAARLVGPLWRATFAGVGDFFVYRREFRTERKNTRVTDRAIERRGHWASAGRVMSEGRRLKALHDEGVHV